MARPVRKDQIVLPTECELCGAKFSNPSRAATHAGKRHKRGNRANQGGKTGVVGRSEAAEGSDTTMRGTPPTEAYVCEPLCMDRGDDWAKTPCLCGCHYQGMTARQMIKAAAEAGVEELYDDQDV